MATQQNTGGRIYQSQTQGQFQGSAQSIGFRPQQAASSEKKDQVRLAEIDRAQATQRRELERQQRSENTLLKAQQAVDKGALTFQNTKDKGDLEMQHLAEKADLEIDQQYTKDTLEYEQSWQERKMGLDMQLLRSKAQVQNAKTQAISTTVNSLLSFANSSLNYVAEQDKLDKIKQAEQAVIDSGAWAFTSDYDINLGGSAVVEREAAQVQVENLEESVINSATDDPLQQENLRSSAGYQATSFRQQRQLTVGEASAQVGLRMQEAFYDPATQITLPDGRTIAPTAAANPAELNYVVRALAQGVTREFGADAYKDDYAAVKQYIPRLEAAVNNLVSQNQSKVIAAAQSNRQSLGFSNAGKLLENTGDVGTAWSQFYSAAWTSGAYGADQAKATKAAVEAFVEYATPGQIADLKNTRVYENGPTFATDKRFNKILEEAAYNKDAFSLRQMRQQNDIQAVQLSNAQNDFTNALIDAGTDQSAIQEAHLNYERVLREYADSGNTKAKAELIEQLSLDNNYTPQNAADFQARIAAGDLPTEQELTDAMRTNRITPSEYDDIKKLGVSSPTDLKNKYGGQAQYKASNSLTEQIVERTLEEAIDLEEGYDRSLLKDAAAPVAQDIIARRDAAVKEYMKQFPDASSGDVQQFANKWVKDNVEQLTKGIKYDATGSLSGYTYMNQANASDTTGQVSKAIASPFSNAYVRGPNGEAITGYDFSEVTPKGMTLMQRESVNIDHNKYLTTQERNAGIKAYATGGSYPPSITKKAYSLGVTPDQLVRAQAAQAGYQLGEKPQQRVEASQPTNLQSGFEALTSMGFPVRGAAFLAGNIQQESGWNGQRTWGEVMGDGSDRNGGLVSWMDDAQRNHFRLRNIESYLGKPISQATAAEQLQAMVWEMKQRNPSAYRTFMNPNATDAQLRRASYQYWGYGHEGARFTYASSLLR